jgi:ribosomal protein L11 methyltransferase
VIRLGIRVRAADAEIAFARLEPVLAAGVEEVEIDDAIEFAIYGDDVPDARLRALAGDTLLAVTREPVDPGWERAWHDHLRPVTVGDLTFRPPWVDGDPGDLVIDPGVTFGLAAHPTTQLCLRILHERPRGALADWGTGSGVLAIAAARLGFAPVVAIDHDPAAVDMARTNAAANGVQIEVWRADARRDAPYADTVVANLTLPVLGALEFDRPPDTLIASGILAGQSVSFPGLVERERREAYGWAAMVLERA